MKKAIYDSLLPFILMLIALSHMACKERKTEPFSHCYLHEELSDARFSVYYIGNSEPLLKGDLKLSKDLKTWQYGDDSDFQKKAIGDVFAHKVGRLIINDLNLCLEENYTLRFVSFDQKDTHSFKLVKRSVDDRFGAPIFSYLFETVNPKTGLKEYYRFNKE